VVKRDWLDVDDEEGAKQYFGCLMPASVQAKALHTAFALAPRSISIKGLKAARGASRATKIKAVA